MFCCCQGNIEAVLEGVKGLPPIRRFTLVFAILVVLIILLRPAVPPDLLPLFYVRFVVGKDDETWKAHALAQAEIAKRESKSVAMKM